jgi:GTP pyrophosphokinase
MKEAAKKLAQTAHESQERKFSGQPYWYHPVRVAHTVEDFGGSKSVVVAAYLHDVVEDTGYTVEDVADEFGGEVAAIVLELTNDEEQISQVGKTEYMKHKLASMSEDALLVKLADRLDNTSDLSEVESDFAPRYAAETKEALDHLESVRTLYGAHKRLVNEIRKNIKKV